MYTLSQIVLSHGGFQCVTKNLGWSDVAKALGIPKSVTNAGFKLKKHYHHLLLPYENRLMCAC